MAELKSDPMAETKSETPVAEKSYAMRLATDAQGNHGYEIGYFPLNADLNDPREFVVVEKAYGQIEAAARTNALNLGSDPFETPQVEPHEDEDEDERAARARRAQHGPIRHKSR